MSELRLHGAKPSAAGRTGWLVAVLCGLIVVAFAPSARAAVGYEPDASTPTKSLPGAPKGITVDPATQDVYVAIVSTNPNTGALGEVARYNSDLTADGIFAPGGGYYTGVAMNPAGGFFAAQMEIRGTPVGNVGTPRMDKFTSGGASAGSFALTYSDSFPPIVSDAAGNVFVPNVNTDSVQVFSSTGTLLKAVTCAGCPGGTFGKPGSVALDASGNLYVADTDPDRVVKLTPSGGNYAFASLLQSGKGAGAVAVDPSNGDIFVGDMPGGDDFHVVAYNSAGTQYDDFGAGLFADASKGGYGALSAYQIAVNATTHKLYVGDVDKLHIFERTTADPPSATAGAVTSVGQLTATINAAVNANGHATSACEFEYTDEADTAFASAESVPCPKKPDGYSATALKYTLSGLTPGTGYRFRVKTESNAGAATSSSVVFQTLPELPPSVATEAAQEIGQTEATLKGSVNPHGGAASDCHFELGTSTAYGTDIPCSGLPGMTTASVPESVTASTLSPGTTYHYRLVVSTNAGTGEGDDVAFTTASPPSDPQDPGAPSSPQPPNPPPSPTGPIVKKPLPRCKKGYRRVRLNGRARCVKICRKGFVQRRIRGKFKCVPQHRPQRKRHRVPAAAAK